MSSSSSLSSFNAYWARLNSAERRFVIGVGVLFFIVINFFWVWPHFSDWDRTQYQLKQKRSALATYQAIIAQKATLEAELHKLIGQGPTVPPEDQATEFFRTINTTASQNGVSFIGSSRSVTKTNQFFVEWVQTVQVQATEKQLVDFLYSLGSDSSMIRVRALSVHPDPSRQQLSANITLVASYQRNPKAGAATGATAATASTTPATTAAPAPSATAHPPGVTPPSSAPGGITRPSSTAPPTNGARPLPLPTAHSMTNRNFNSLLVKTSMPPTRVPIVKPATKP